LPAVLPAPTFSRQQSQLTRKRDVHKVCALSAKEENMSAVTKKAAIEAYGRVLERHGHFSDRYRTFAREV
jgi:hypothetical protein